MGSPKAGFDPKRLYTQLQNTGLQNKDQNLYQLLYQMIGIVKDLNVATTTIVSGGSSVINNIINESIFQIGDSSGDSDGDSIIIPGPRGEAGPTVPYFIDLNEVFVVPLFKQALFSMNIENNGFIQIDGFLIEVDDSDSLPLAQLSDTTTQAPGVTTPIQITFNTEDRMSGVTHSGGNITILETGVYQIIVGGQITEVNNGKVNFDMWLRVNASNLANSGVRNSIANNADNKVIILNYIASLVAGDVLKVFMSVDDATKVAGLTPFTPAGEAAIPSVMLSLFKIGHV